MSEIPGSQPCSYSGGECILYSTYCGPRHKCVFDSMDLPEEDEGLLRYRALREQHMKDSRLGSSGREPSPGDNN